MRKRVSRRARIQLALGLVVLAAMSAVGYATLRIFGDTGPLLSTAELRKGIPPLPSPPPDAVVKSATIAVLNFRHWSVARGVGEVQSPFNSSAPKRGRLSISIELPLFSPAGEYRVSLRAGTDKPLVDKMAVARNIGGRTVVDPVGIDLLRRDLAFIRSHWKPSAYGRHLNSPFTWSKPMKTIAPSIRPLRSSTGFFVWP